MESLYCIPEMNIILRESFQVGLVVKNLPANAGVVTDSGSISGSRRPPEEGMATHSM